uniref:Uncharacterized protein n=1 Tax=Prolemur simus TaxID=1328070 RepID=A0A8C8ZPL8_PROSS
MWLSKSSTRPVGLPCASCVWKTSLRAGAGGPGTLPPPASVCSPPTSGAVSLDFFFFFPRSPRGILPGRECGPTYAAACHRFRPAPRTLRPGPVQVIVAAGPMAAALPPGASRAPSSTWRRHLDRGSGLPPSRGIWEKGELCRVPHLLSGLCLLLVKNDWASVKAWGCRKHRTIRIALQAR